MKKTEQTQVAIETVLQYHERTKHHYHRFARSLGYLDWATQPVPFRENEGAQQLSLPLPQQNNTPPYHQLFMPGKVPPKALNRESISEFFFYALAISAWKSSGGATWALRVNPSSGNLHPTEGYLIAGPVLDLTDKPGLYHYRPDEHGLECRTEFQQECWNQLRGNLPESSCLLALSSIHWREAWKYGERAYRYCQHDVGHALAACRLSAALQGWDLHVTYSITSSQLKTLLGLDREQDFHPQEEEVPDLLAILCPANAPLPDSFTLALEAIESIKQGSWQGKANLLSVDHHDWNVISEVSQATELESIQANPKRTTKPAQEPITHVLSSVNLTAGHIIRQRRSAVAMDGESQMESRQFYHLLSQLIPELNPVPWDSTTWPIHIHLALFVHRVEGIEPGLYFLLRDRDKLEQIKNSLDEGFEWIQPEKCPSQIPLYQLQAGDFRAQAAQISCMQEIASDGTFSCGMLAEYESPIREQGAHKYPRLFWEAGMVGQMLYLESEACGFSGTGIGCYFDDAMHELLGLRDRQFQSLYHFTVGRAVKDTRITTLPAYPNLTDLD